MITRWTDLGRTFSALDELQRRMDSVHRGWFHQANHKALSSEGWPAVDLFDAGEELVLRAELPGVNEDNIELTLNQNVLTLAGHREVAVEEGYRAHRRERADLRFSRSFKLPGKVDPEKVAAETTDGILTVRIAKAPEAQPRQITVTAGK